MLFTPSCGSFDDSSFIFHAISFGNPLKNVFCRAREGRGDPVDTTADDDHKIMDVRHFFSLRSLANIWTIIAYPIESKVFQWVPRKIGQKSSPKA